MAKIKSSDPVGMKNALQGKTVLQADGLTARSVTTCRRQLGTPPPYVLCVGPQCLDIEVPMQGPDYFIGLDASCGLTTLDNFTLEWYQKLLTNTIFWETDPFNDAALTVAQRTAYLDVQLYDDVAPNADGLFCVADVGDYAVGQPSGATGNPNLIGPRTIAGGGVQVIFTTPTIAGATYQWTISNQMPTGTHGITLGATTTDPSVRLQCDSKYANGADPGNIATTAFDLRIVVTLAGVDIVDTTETIDCVPTHNDELRFSIAVGNTVGAHHYCVQRTAAEWMMCIDGIKIATTPRTTGDVPFDQLDASYEAFTLPPSVVAQSFKQSNQRLSNVALYVPPFIPPARAAIVVLPSTLWLYKFRDGNINQITDELGNFTMPIDPGGNTVSYGNW